jgi:hypothetical protein
VDERDSIAKKRLHLARKELGDSPPAVGIREIGEEVLGVGGGPTADVDDTRAGRNSGACEGGTDATGRTADEEEMAHSSSLGAPCNRLPARIPFRSPSRTRIATRRSTRIAKP